MIHLDYGIPPLHGSKNWTPVGAKHDDHKSVVVSDPFLIFHSLVIQLVNCMRQPERHLHDSSYNHDTLTTLCEGIITNVLKSGSTKNFMVLIGIGSNFILGGGQIWTAYGSSTRKVWNFRRYEIISRAVWNFRHSEIISRAVWDFRHSEIVSRAILQALQQSPVHCYSWGTQLGLEGSTSAGLDECTIFSAKIVYARNTWPCRFSSNWCIAFCANIAYTKPCLSRDIVCSHHMHAHVCTSHARDVICATCMNINNISRQYTRRE